MKTALKGNVILPDRILNRGAVLIEEEKITGIYSRASGISEKIDAIDYGDSFISPGLVDLHLHGALGMDVMDCDIKSLEQIVLHQARCGVTGFLGTTVSSSLDSLLKAVETIKEAAQFSFPSELLGVHIEGPFLSEEKKGAHDPSFIREINKQDIQSLIRSVQGLKAIVSMAPEVENNMSFIKTLTENGIIVSIGHSDATYEEALESFNQGITHATHLFNAMSGYHHKEPGVVGAVLDSPKVTAELIADGVHLHPSALRLVFSRKDKDKICLITDSLKATGMGDGHYKMGNLEFTVKGTEARLRKNGVLAGSVLTLNKAIRNAINWTESPVNQAVNMASLNPARVLGLDDKIGSIQEGKYANLAVFDSEFNVVQTILRGRFVLKGKN